MRTKAEDGPTDGECGRWRSGWPRSSTARIRLALEAGRVDLAGDLADWMVGVVDRLTPFLPIDRLAREAALPCLAGEVQLRRTTGDERAPARPSRRCVLESLGGP